MPERFKRWLTKVFTRSFHHARPDRQVLRPQVRIRHVVTMLPKIRERLMNRLTTGIARAQAT
jgi:hypothetical protein